MIIAIFGELKQNELCRYKMLVLIKDILSETSFCGRKSKKEESKVFVHSDYFYKRNELMFFCQINKGFRNAAYMLYNFCKRYNKMQSFRQSIRKYKKL